jgi:hypothetical protein
MNIYDLSKKELQKHNEEIAVSLGINKIRKTILTEIKECSKNILLGTNNTVETSMDYEYVAEYFLAKVDIGLTEEKVSNQERTACLLAGYVYSLYIDTGTSIPLMRKCIGAKCISKIQSNYKRHITIDTCNNIHNFEGVIERSVFMLNQLAYNNRSFRRVGHYSEEETSVRVLRDSMKMFVFLPEDVVKQYVNVYHEHNLSIRKYNAINDEPLVPENFYLFVNNLYNEMVTTPWYSLWGKRYAFNQNYPEHAKKVLKLRDLKVK